MSISSRTVWRIVWGVTGVAYAAFCGFWFMILTGGGHANLIWPIIFIFVDILGLYFPLMGVLSLNLDSQKVRTVFGALLGLNLLLTIFFILFWITGRFIETDYDGTPAELILFAAPAQFIPSAVFGAIFLRSILSLGDRAKTLP